jgi:cell wall-associated NlpC family hydrolase
MGEATTERAGDGSARPPECLPPAVRWPSRRQTRFKAVASAVTAFALALPLVGLTESVQPQQAVAAPDPMCLSTDSALPATQSGRETAAARAAALWFPAGQVAMATAVAGAESSWNPTAVNKAAGGNYGLWQINSVHDRLLDARQWSDPQDNAWMAYQVWDAADGTKGDGQGSWKPWSVYNSGSYRAYLRDTVPTAGSGAVDGGYGDTTDCPAPIGSQVRVATWNVLASNANGRIADGVRDLTTRTDVFGLQEMGSRSDRATAAKAAVGFTMSTDRTAVPIFYRTDKYTVITQGRERAFEAGENTEAYGGQSGRTKGKWVTWVQLQDNATRETFYVLNTHFLVGAYNNKKQTKKNDRRVALYQRQLATVTGLVDSFQASGAAVYVTCDCNVNYDPDAGPVELMSDHGISPNWQHLDGKATIGKKTRLDYVWSNRAPTEQTVGDKHGSDHSPVIVTYPPSTGSSGTMTPVNGSTSQEIYSMRTISDPSSGQTYLVPIPTGKVGKVLEKALNQVGDRWEFGGDGSDAWDCSGLTASAWAAADVTLPHQSEDQQRSVRNVDLADAQPGDIFWRKGYVSIFLGTAGGERVAVGAAKSKGAVVIHTVDESDVDAVLQPAG